MSDITNRKKGRPQIHGTPANKCFKLLKMAASNSKHIKQN